MNPKIGLSALIVEDFPEAIEVIKTGIEEFNKGDYPIYFPSIRNANSYKSAAIILEQENIGLIFLDITLIGSKTGIDLMRDYSHYSYVIVSGDERASESAINNTSGAKLHSFRLKLDNLPTVDDVKEAITKFVADKNKSGGFYSNSLIIGKNIINLNSVAIISKRYPYHINANRQLEQCTDCGDGTKDSLFFCKNIIDPSTAHHCLFSTRIKDTHYTISSIIANAKLDPKRFIIITPNTIVNLDHLAHVDKDTLIIKIQNTLSITVASISGDSSLLKLHRSLLAERN